MAKISGYVEVLVAKTDVAEALVTRTDGTKEVFTIQKEVLFTKADGMVEVFVTKIDGTEEVLFTMTDRTKEVLVRKTDGTIEVLITKTDETEEVLVTNLDKTEEVFEIQGGEFGLEQGGDWRRDHDDGELFAGFIYIAFLDGFDLVFSFNIHGNSISNEELVIRKNDFERHNIQNVKIIEDQLDIDEISSPHEDDDF